MSEKLTIDAALEIEGREDTVQLEVQGHSTQTEPLQEWQDDGGQALSRVTGNGKVQVGDVTNDPEGQIEADVLNADTSGSVNATGIKSSVSNAGASAHLAEAVGIEVTIDDNNPTGGITTAYGVRVQDVEGTAKYAIYTGAGAVRVGEALDLQEQSAEPAAPPSDDVRLFIDQATGQLRQKDSDGNLSVVNTLDIHRPVWNGDFGSWDTMSAPSGGWVVEESGATLAREDATVKIGTYSAKLTRSGTDCFLKQNIYDRAGGDAIRGVQHTLGAWVHASVANRAKLRVRDGVSTWDSAYHSGGSGWEWLTVTCTPNTTATLLNVGLFIQGGDTSAYLDGVALVKGSVIDEGSIPWKHANGIPRRATLWHDEAIAESGTSFLLWIGTSQAYNFMTYTNTNGAAFTHSFYLKAGTYTFKVLGCAAYNRGKIDWYIDGQLVGSGGQDWFTSRDPNVTTYNHIEDETVTIEGDGYHILRGVVNGTSDPQGNYVMSFTKYWFEPAED